MNLAFRILPGTFAVCRFAADADPPSSITRGDLLSITRTREELSLVCPESAAPSGAKCEGNWACLKLEGPFPFALTGILSSFLLPLAQHNIPIFAVSTFDTDYVLVKRETLEAALAALEAAGHRLLPS